MQPFAIVGRYPAKRHRAARRTARQRPIGVLFAQGCAQDRCGGDGDVGQEGLGPVAAVEEHALLRIVAVVVVPVDESAWLAGRELQRVHRDGARDVDFTRAGHQLLAHHAHDGAAVDAVVLLQRAPALNGGGVQIELRHPLRDDDAELRHEHQRRIRNAGRRGIAGDVGELGRDAAVAVIQAPGAIEHF